MTRLLTTLSALLLAMTLAACGFHLRGLDSTPRAFPFSRLYIDSTQPAAQQVAAALKAYPQLTILDSANGADAVLRITGEGRNKEVSDIDRSGQANEYRLNYSLTAQLWVNGAQAGRDIVLRQSRTMTYSDSVVLGKDQEETLLWNDMTRTAAQLLVFRLSSQRMIQDAASAAAGVVPDSKANDAGHQP
ncbi:LPS assembly lipoprotein LptE [Paludibacterium sp.]|uniref:LPS-assembly lipoprotein LptE n=1 Tax=Paludibacterium sp. TaxID=1917523 RepID=UPI0025E4E13A|nr:LPS assembly lipoprotein LptE [Paludibacterium sp.]MBV8647600.1 hypothetical protein [Paludibacterium sp.]